MSGETDGKMIGCVAGRYVLSGQLSAESGRYHGENHHFSAGFGIKGIMEAWVRQDSFVKFIAVKRKEYYFRGISYLKESSIGFAWS